MLKAIVKQKNVARLLLMVAILASLVVATIWFVSREDVERHNVAMSADMPVYSSLEELADVSDLVVLGTVKGVVARDVDYGTENPPEGADWGNPVVFYEFAVIEVVSGELDQDTKTIVVGSIDLDKVQIDEELTALLIGQRVLLFLQDDDAPGITAVEDYYVTVSMDNGVFDIVGDGDVLGPTGRVNESIILNPRGSGSDMFGEETFTMSDIRQAIELEPGKTEPTHNTN